MKKIIMIGICMLFIVPIINATFINEPPSTPTIEGPTSGKAGTEYEFHICSTDPDGDNISYCIDWDDGGGELCLGPYPSGACISETHSWPSEGSYTIRVKARDSNQAESEYATLSVSMPKSKPTLQFFEERLPYLFTLLSSFLN